MKFFIKTLLCMVIYVFDTETMATHIPRLTSSLWQQQLGDVAKMSTLVGLQLSTGALAAGATDSNNNVKDSKDSRFTTIGKDMPVCRLLTGMWQVSGAHGFDPNKDLAVADMARHADAGYTTFDLADIYGPAEDYVGAFRKGPLASSTSKNCQFFTKYVPRPDEMTRRVVTNAIDRSLTRMKVEALDLLQFHWWDYDNLNYYDAMAHLMDLQQNEKIRNIGLTNFDTEHMMGLIAQDAPIVSNQVSFSILDTRPLQFMVPASLEKNVKLLCYGSLLGGFLSSTWKDKPEPSVSSLTNVSLRKYLPWIQYWGGWELFQELLTTLDGIAKKYSVSISNVALRWVIEQQAVGGAIVGVRLGYKQHIKDNDAVFNFNLDEEDYDRIAAVQKKSNNLMNVFGDCGGEYRTRKFRQIPTSPTASTSATKTA